jgi:hypothetical protein
MDAPRVHAHRTDGGDDHPYPAAGAGHAGYSPVDVRQRNRNATESTASGLRYAQATAISSNRNAVRARATGWNVAMVDAPLVSIQTASFNEGAKT